MRNFVFLGRYTKNLFFLLLALLFAFFSPKSVFATDFIYESFISTDSHKIEIIGNVPGGQLGAVIASGDFNSDGIGDLVIGSPFSSTSQKEWNGSVIIMFGQSNFGNNMIDLFQISPGIEFLGEYPGDQLGSAIETGDYNNDGIDDIAIGAYNAYSETERPGKVYIFYGKVVWDRQIIDLSTDDPDFELIGKSEGDRFGLSLFTIDINNDNIDDLLVGAPFASTYNINNPGVVYGYLGAPEAISPLFDTLFYGQNENERFGSSLSGGDVNGDGRTDVVIGAYFASNDNFEEAGKVYLYTELKSPAPIIISDPTFSLKGTVDNEWFGFSLDVGDVNGDGKDDIAVSSFPYMGERNAGKVSIFYGEEEFNDLVNVIIENPVSEALPGADVSLKDLDLDNKAEIIIGAPGVGGPISVDEGDVYIVYSNYIEESIEFSIKDQTITSIIHGENADDWFGYSVESLDFNGDGYQDLAIGSRYSDSPHSANNGKVFILLGSGVPFGNKKQVLGDDEKHVNRGEFISAVIEKFDLKNKKAIVIRKCYDHREFCLFNFLAMSSYDDIQLEPKIILYPDISSTNMYYEDITTGTMLGLINGYLSEDDSPFHSENPVSKIQALKVVLGAADLMPPKYQFELIDVFGSLEKLRNQFSYFSDVDARISHMWWYPRYVNFAVEKSLIDRGDLFRPDDNITKEELDDMIDRTLRLINPGSEEMLKWTLESINEDTDEETES